MSLAQQHDGRDVGRVGERAAAGPDSAVVGHGLAVEANSDALRGRVDLDHPADRGRVDGIVAGAQDAVEACRCRPGHRGDTGPYAGSTPKRRRTGRGRPELLAGDTFGYLAETKLGQSAAGTAFDG